MRGARRLGRGTVNPSLRELIDRGVREGQFSLRVIGIAAGFPDPQTLSKHLHAEFATSPLMLERWRRVARIAGFNGEPVLPHGGVEHGER